MQVEQLFAFAQASPFDSHWVKGYQEEWCKRMGAKF